MRDPARQALRRDRARAARASRRSRSTSSSPRASGASWRRSRPTRASSSRRCRGPTSTRVTGVPPSIALEQRTSRGGANSTVATVTEIAHYLRLLYAKVGELHCPKCDAVVAPSAPTSSSTRLARRVEARSSTVYAPAVRARKGRTSTSSRTASRAGVQTARVDGAIVRDRSAAEAREDEGALDRSHRPLRHARRASIAPTFDRALAWGGGAVASHGARPPPSPRRARRSSRPRARAPRAARACRSSTRAGSRSTRSRVSARRARARGSRRRSPRRSTTGEPRETCRRVQGDSPRAPARGACGSAARRTPR